MRRKMQNIVTIHQVNYIPWIGFFNKIKKADTFVLFDIADYEKNSVQNRNKIRTKDGWIYLTIPVSKQYYRKPFFQVKFPEDTFWMSKHWKSIEINYSKAQYFDSYKDFFKEIYFSKFEYLSDFNEKIIRYLIKELGINVNILKSTEMNINEELKSTDLLIDILKKAEATNYLSGKSGKNYLEKEKFSDIKLEFHEFTHPEYTQVFSPFIPALSSIDLLFNEGEKSGGFLK
jgi:hypothetical protein